MRERGIHRPDGRLRHPFAQRLMPERPTELGACFEARERHRVLEVRLHRRVTVHSGERAIDGAVEVVHRLET